MARRILFAAIVIIFWWLATAGDWNLFGEEDFGSFYDYQALAFRHARLDVPPAAVGYEAFVYQGKYFGYWGPFPALLRLPLALFGRGAWVGHTARFSCFVAACLSFLALARLAVSLRGYLRPATSALPFETVCITGLALGTTLVFLIAKPFIYHEVILWAGATSLLALWWSVNYLRTASPAWLVLAAGAGVCSALTRPTLGFGALLGVMLLTLGVAWRRASAAAPGRGPRPSRRLLLIIAGLAAGGVATSLLYNYIRFDAWSPPYPRQLLYTPERLAKTHGGHMFQISNLPEVLAVYLGPTRLRVLRHFPYFFLDQFWPDAKTGVVIDNTEPQAGLLATSSAATVLAGAGLLLAFRRIGLAGLALGTLASIAGACIFAFVTERYLHDFFPALTLGAVIGAIYLAPRHDILSRSVKYILGAGFGLAVFQNMALALELQRESRPLRDPARLHYENVGAEFDRKAEEFRRKAWHLPLSHLDVAAWRDLPEDPQTGTLATLLEPYGMLWYDGVAWRKVAGRCEEIFEQRLQVTLPPDGIPRAEPILSMGGKEAANIVFFQTDGGPFWSINCDVWGRAILRSKLWKPIGRTMDITVRLDRINHRVQIYDGANMVLDGAVLPHELARLPVYLGENPFGGSWSGPKFSGGISQLPPLSP